ncbi:MAG: murein biosynthesis integral membrane protein MurJ [Rickettsiales bacterium]|nr:MAG: murein biosynthesis integral membrane protein MurJ [Rickettsiales bacterium]
MKKFFNAFFGTSFGTLLSRIAGYTRDIFIAKYLGSGFYADIFFISFKIPNFFRKITAEGALQSAFVPIFADGIKNHTEKNMFAFARNIFSYLLYFLILFTALAEIFMPQLMQIFAPGYEDEKMQFAILFTRITFPYLIFISVVALISAILNSYGRFFITAVCPVILNLSLIFFLLISHNLTSAKIVLFLSFGVLFAGLFQLVFMVYFVVKYKFLLFPVRPHWTYQTKQFFKKFWQIFLASGIVQINSLVNSILGTFVATGGVSYLYYADRIVQFPLSLIGTTISISILPHLSAAFGKNGDSSEIQVFQESSFFLSLFLGLPAAIGLFILSQPIVGLLFERGEFTGMDTINVSIILQFYAISLPFYILSKTLNTILYAKKETKFPMQVSLLNLFLNVSISLLLLKRFEIVGIAFAGVVSTITSTLLLFYKVFKERIFVIRTEFYIKILKIVYIAITMGICVLCLRIGIEKYYGDFIQLIIAGGIGGLLFLYLSQAMGVINLWELFDLVRKKETNDIE